MNRAAYTAGDRTTKFTLPGNCRWTVASARFIYQRLHSGVGQRIRHSRLGRARRHLLVFRASDAWRHAYRDTSQLYISGVLSISSSVSLPGDYNGDGSVDAADYVVWRKNDGTNNTLPNDLIGGTIGPAQYNQWRANFGQSVGNGSLSDAAVPEPASALRLSWLL